MDTNTETHSEKLLDRVRWGNVALATALFVALALLVAEGAGLLDRPDGRATTVVAAPPTAAVIPPASPKRVKQASKRKQGRHGSKRHRGKSNRGTDGRSSPPESQPSLPASPQAAESTPLGTGDLEP
jgi:hypothetical protein